MTDAEKLAHHERLKTKLDEEIGKRIGFVVEEAFNDELTELTHPLEATWRSLDVNVRGRCRVAWRKRAHRAYFDLVSTVLDEMLVEEERRP